MLSWIREHRKLLSVIMLAELAAVVLVSTIDPHAHIDGEIYRLGAQALLNGQPIYVGLPPSRTGLHLPFIYPPFAAIVFIPLALVSLTGAIAMIMLLTHLCLLATLYVTVRASRFMTEHQDKIVLTAAAALPLATMLEPVRETITYAQINIVLMALVAVDCLWRVGDERELPYPRGLLIGIAAGIKLTPAAFLLFFLLRRDFRSIGVAIATFLGTVVLGLIVAFDAAKQFWLHELLSSSEVSFGPKFPGNASIYAGNVSLRSLLAKVPVPEPWLTVGWAVLILIMFALALAGMLHGIRSAADPHRTASSMTGLPTALCVNAVFALLISPISWSHHWVWAAPVLLLLIGGAYVRRNWSLLLAATLVGQFFVLGPHWLVPQGNGKELTWNFFEHLIGNAYVYFGVAFLLYNAYGWWSARRRRHGAVRSQQASPAA